jgi:hypothetical protein
MNQFNESMDLKSILAKKPEELSKGEKGVVVANKGDLTREVKKSFVVRMSEAKPGFAFTTRKSSVCGNRRSPDFASLHPGYALRLLLSFRDAPLGAGPESILTMVVMDSGLALRAPRNDGLVS